MNLLNQRRQWPVFDNTKNQKQNGKNQDPGKAKDDGPSFALFVVQMPQRYNHQWWHQKHLHISCKVPSLPKALRKIRHDYCQLKMKPWKKPHKICVFNRQVVDVQKIPPPALGTKLGLWSHKSTRTNGKVLVKSCVESNDQGIHCSQSDEWLNFCNSRMPWIAMSFTWYNDEDNK